MSGGASGVRGREVFEMDDFLEIVAFRRRQGMYTALYFFCWGFIIAFGLIAAFTLANIVGVNPETGGMLFSWQSLLLTLAFGAAAFGLWRASDSCRVEYDYTFTNGDLDVGKVFGNARRKLMTSLNMKNVEMAGMVTHQSFQRFMNDNSVKKHNWFVNRGANLSYFYFQKENQKHENLKHVIVLELSDEMITMLKPYLKFGVWQGENAQVGPRF